MSKRQQPNPRAEKPLKATNGLRGSRKSPHLDFSLRNYLFPKSKLSETNVCFVETAFFTYKAIKIKQI